jgi:hypothetical protein
VVTFEVELENAIGSLICCLPYATLEPIRSKLHASFQSERLEVDHAWIARFKERLLETPVQMVIELGQTQITGRQLLNLEIGDILLLNTDTERILEAEWKACASSYGCPVGQGQQGLPVVARRNPLHLHPALAAGQFSWPPPGRWPFFAPAGTGALSGLGAAWLGIGTLRNARRERGWRW